MHLRGVTFSYSSNYENQQLLPVPALFWGEATTNKAQSAYRTESGSINPWSDQTDLVFTQFFQCSPFFPMFTIFLASSPFSQRMTACLPTSVPPKKIQSRRPSAGQGCVFSLKPTGWNRPRLWRPECGHFNDNWVHLKRLNSPTGRRPRGYFKNNWVIFLTLSFVRHLLCQFFPIISLFNRFPYQNLEVVLTPPRKL